MTFRSKISNSSVPANTVGLGVNRRLTTGKGPHACKLPWGPITLIVILNEAAVGNTHTQLQSNMNMT